MSWLAASLVVLGLALVAGFAWYERTHPTARVLALVATLAALAALGRIAFAPLPSVKPTTDIVVLSGYVLGTTCQPVAGALLDWWQADDRGLYDNVGYRLRGHQFTDESGRYSLETIVPGLYPGRTRHFHLKVQAPNRPILTTQLYFPNEPANRRDGIYRRELELDVQDTADGKVGRFNFVLDLG